MRTALPLLLCTLFATASSAQTLTNGQIYDYQVGDVFQSEGQFTNAFGQSQPPHIYTDTVLVREEFGADSIRYALAHWEVAYQYFPLAPVVTSSIDTLIVRDLDQVPEHAVLCQQEDTLAVYNPQCGLLRWTFQNGGLDSCMGEFSSYWYYQGCGGPFSDYYMEDVGGTLFELIYYHKGDLMCGAFWDLPLAVPPTGGADPARITPNPTTGLIHLQGLSPRGAIIVNALGACVGQVVNGVDADLSRWPAGLYWVIGEDALGRGIRMPLVKQ